LRAVNLSEGRERRLTPHRRDAVTHSRRMSDPDKKKARKRTKKRKRRDLERAVEENGHHSREKRKGKRER